jgi:hypothetical protein
VDGVGYSARHIDLKRLVDHRPAPDDRMHFHFPFTAVAVLWTLTFAAHLVLIVVLFGRDRARRFPVFTASIVFTALRLLVARLLLPGVSQMAGLEIVLVTAVIGVVLSLLVVVELARHAFRSARREAWLAGALVVMAIGAAVLWFWGPWPHWTEVKQGSPWELLQLLAQKGSLLVDVENIAVGLAIVLLGYRCGAGWRSHTQRIVIGLSTASIGELAVPEIWRAIARHSTPHSMAEYTHLIGLREKLYNANSALFFAVLVWWIVCLWRDEPGTTTAEAQVVQEEPLVLESRADDASEASGSRPIE